MKFDKYSMTGATPEDCAAIQKMIDAEVDMTIDAAGRVWNEGGPYIANCVDTEPGDGIGC